LKKAGIAFFTSTLLLLSLAVPGKSQAWQTGFDWWLAGATLKVPPSITKPLAPAAHLHLYAARQEYAPFQIVFKTGAQALDLTTLVLDFPRNRFEVMLYRERYLDLAVTNTEPEIYSLIRLQETALPDGLEPLSRQPIIPANSTGVVWVDLYVRANTPAGDYNLTLSLAGGRTREVAITVYPVDLVPSAAMNIIIPVDAAYEIAFYKTDNLLEYHQAVNDLLRAHDLIPGNFAIEPELTPEGWDFYGLDAELDALPPGSTFYVPSPYSTLEEAYLFPDETGRFYTYTDFADDYFLRQLQGYYNALAAYLRGKNRLQDALAYPSDETVWVADEPYHNGPAGFEHLAQWTQVVRNAGFRLRASGVNTTPVGPPELGWLASEQVADDLHVHIDTYDGALDAFDAWRAAAPNQTVSLYLNHYGDLIDLPAAMQRGLIWHAYGHNIRDIAGYAAMEWLTQTWELVDPWTQASELYPQFTGYGVGALVWPGPLPSIRLKLLREGVEDARLLDLYGAFAGADKAQALATCLTPGALADQNPPAELWDNMHTALLSAISHQQVIATDNCLPPAFAERQPVLDLDSKGNNLDDWDLIGVEATIENTGVGQGDSLRIVFTGAENEAGYWLGSQDWSQWQALQVELQSESPYFSELDIGLSDAQGNFVLLRNGAIIVGPNASRTLTLPLARSLGDERSFDWSQVTYISISVGTETTQTDGYGDTYTYSIGSRTMIFDNFTLAR
jgi:hypothetical protein